MSLHVTGQEAASCVRFLEKAFSKWEREQAEQQRIIARQCKDQRAEKRPTYKAGRKDSRTGRKNPRRVWTEEQTKAIEAAIATEQTTRSLAVQLNIPYAAVWIKRAEVEHSLKLSRLSDATSSSGQRVSVPHTE